MSAEHKFKEHSVPEEHFSRGKVNVTNLVNRLNQEKKKVDLDLGLLFNPNNTIGIGGLTLRLSF